MARNSRSAKNLWSLVSGTSILKSTAIIGNELQENAHWLLNGILYYKKAEGSSVAQLKDVHQDPELEFIGKLHKILDIDATQCSELFTSFISYEYKGTQKNLKSLLKNERHTEAVIFELWNYYYSERLYCLLTMKHILEHWKDEKDPYRVLYDDFLKCINEKDVVKKIVEQLEMSFALEVPVRDASWSSVYDLLVQHWVVYILREQSELLQLLLLYYKVMEPSASDIIQIFSMFQKHGFGSRQPFRQYLSEDVQPLVDAVGYLECLVIIQCFQLDQLNNIQEDSMNVDHFLLKDEAAIKSLNTMVHSLGTHQSHGPILLAWMVLGQKLNSLHFNDCSKLGDLSLQLGVFEYLLQTLNSPVFSASGAVTVIMNSVVYGMLCQLLTEFELCTLGPVKPIFQLAESILKFEVIAGDFWEKGLDYGVGILMKSSLEMFPIDFCSLVTLSSSLSKSGKDSCEKVLKHIKNLRTFCELMENTNISDVVATREASVLKLARSIALYGDASLIVPEGTLGVLLPEAEKGQTIIQWHTAVNGWQVCLREVYMKLQDISVSMGAADSESMSRMIAVADLVHSLLKTDPETRDSLRHIINVLFSILHRFSTHPSPPVDFVAKMFDIAAALYKSKSTSAWSNILQMNFLPSVTTLTQEIAELAGGTFVNIGILGEVIASKECVFGKYRLCIAFVQFIVTLSERLPEEGDSSFLACVLYILREIFSCFHKWFYVDPQEKLIIGQACLNLLHNLFIVDPEEQKTMQKVQQLCTYSLLYYQAGQTLLRIVCTGEEVIHQTILRQNSDFAESITDLIRLSLSVLNRLLLLRHRVVTQKLSAGDSPFERVLFSTPGQSEQPQVVLTVANYAFQHYNPRLATLAVQLLKRFAREFPMSLLACFGSEAEAIRDHFLCRLSSPCEDIRLKISILEFLTVCIAQQPGLIEMFINIRIKDKDQEKEPEEHQGCLTSVKNIVKEQPDSQTDYFQELQCVAVEFIHALWAAHQGLAMEALKKDSEFWSFLCGRLMSEDMEEVNPKFTAYVIRTLALEFFYVSTSTVSGAGDGEVKKIMNGIRERNLLPKWSKHVNSLSPKNGFSSRSHDGTARGLFDDISESLALYTAWRDFVLVIARNESVLNFPITSEAKQSIMNHVLKNISKQIVKDNNSRLLVLLCELYVMLSNLWGSELSLSSSDETFKIFQDLLQYLAQNSDDVRPGIPRIQLAVVTSAIYLISHCSKIKDKMDLHFIEWIPPACQLLRKASLLVDQPAEKEQLVSMLKLPVAVICLLNKLIEESDNWLPLLKSHIVLPLLVSLLMKSLKTECGVKLALSIITLFISMCSNKQAAEALCNTGFMAETMLTLSVIELDLDSSLETGRKVSTKRKVTATNVYYAFLMLIRVLLQALGNYFLHDAMNFVGVHVEHIHATLIHMVKNPLSSNLQDAMLTCNLIYQLSFYQQVWQLEHLRSLEVLLNDISMCSHVAISLLMRPTLLKHLVEHKEFPNKMSITNTEANGIAQGKLPTVEEETAPSEKVVQLQTKLMKLLAVCLAIIKQYSPGLHEVISGHVDHGQWQLLLHPSFQTPATDQEINLSFGALLACISMCLRWLAKNERTPSPSKSFECQVQIERHLLLYVMEVSLTLLLSQCSLALTHPSLSVRDKQLIRRELTAELNVIMQTMHRYMRKGPLSPAGSSSPEQPQTPELPFMKLVDSLVGKLIE